MNKAWKTHATGLLMLAIGACVSGQAQAADTIREYLEDMAAAASPVILIGGGTRVDIGGQQATIHGFDLCPSASDDVLRADCVRLDRPTVPVILLTEGGEEIRETWAVHAENGRTWLTRPNGQLVSAPH